jgi:hypothetical protein
MLQKFQKSIGENTTKNNFLQSYSSQDCKLLEASILNNQSSILIELNKFEQALERSLKAIEINTKLFPSSFNTEIATNLMNTSIIY